MFYSCTKNTHTHNKNQPKKQLESCILVVITFAEQFLVHYFHYSCGRQTKIKTTNTKQIKLLTNQIKNNKIEVKNKTEAALWRQSIFKAKQLSEKHKEKKKRKKKSQKSMEN